MPFLDLRIAIRHLLKSPGFTATAVLMLALGIGATTAIFSVVEGVLLRRAALPHPERLVQLRRSARWGSGRQWRGRSHGSRHAGLPARHSQLRESWWVCNSYELSGIGDPAQVNAARLSAGVFPALGVVPLVGRLFTQQEDDNKEQVAVVSYSLWQSRLHGDPARAGKRRFCSTASPME